MLSLPLQHNLIKQNRNLILYGLIGITGATLDFILYVVFYKALGVPPFISSFLSVSAGIINNFVWNARHNFKVSGKMLSRFASFYLTGLGGALLSVVLILILYNGLGVDATIAKLITIPPVVLLQFWVNKHVSFAENPNKLFEQLVKYISHHWLTTIVAITTSVVYFSEVFYVRATDEMDNLLGGKLILDGQLPYTGFFSQHSPGMYFLSAVLYPFTHGDVFIYRLLFNIISFGLLVWIYFLVKQKVSRPAGALSFVLLGLAHVLAWGFSPLGESLIFYLLPIAILILFFREREHLNIREVGGLSLVLFFVPFVSLSFIFPAAVLYLFVVILMFKEFIKIRHLKVAFKPLMLIVPYVVFGIYIIASRSFSAMKYDVFTYNSHYYASFVGQIGGSPLKVLAGVVLNSLREISIVCQNFLNPIYTVQILLLIGFGLFIIMLWGQQKKLEALAMVTILLVLDVSPNIFNKPAIMSNIASVSHHASPYLGVALLAGSIAAAFYITNRQRSGQSPILRYLLAVYVTVITISCLGIWAKHMDTIFITNTKQSYYAYSQELKRNNLSGPINKIIGVNDRAWIGDSNFPDQLYLQPNRATRFTFWRPWMDVDPTLRNQLIGELSSQKPAIIYFSGQPDTQGNGFNSALPNLLQERYFTVRDSRLKHYHFLSSDRQQLIERLEKLGYEI